MNFLLVENLFHVIHGFAWMYVGIAILRDGEGVVKLMVEVVYWIWLVR